MSLSAPNECSDPESSVFSSRARGRAWCSSRAAAAIPISRDYWTHATTFCPAAECLCLRSGSHMCLLRCGLRTWLFWFVTGISWGNILGSVHFRQVKNCLLSSSSTPHPFKIAPAWSCSNGDNRRNTKDSWSIDSIPKGTSSIIPHSLHQRKSLSSSSCIWVEK